jgi:hypothetical protein
MLALYRKLDEIFLRREGREDVAVKVVFLRPLSGRDSGVALIGPKEDVETLHDTGTLDADSQRILEEELARSYFIPRILRVCKTDAYYGTRYWEVETDCGRRTFALKNPYVNIRWITPDELVIRDVIGNSFHVPSFAALDPQSKAEFERVT